MISSLRISVVTSLFVVCFSLLVPNSAFACHVDDPAFSSSYRGDLNLDLNDYARILADADSNDRTCVEAASRALHDKVLATPPSSWSGWLQTGVAGVALAAANRIGANGFATKDLDSVLKAITPYLAVGHDATNPCAKESKNQCVDDFSVAAPGFAWMAAYKFRRGDPDGDVATLRQQAIGAMQAAFDEVCIRKSDATSLCNGTVADLDANQAVTLSLNHDQQMPSYGFGLMTSIASTVLGLEASNYHYMFPPAQVSIAKALAKEMQAHVSNNQFTSDCIDTITKDAQGIWHTSGAVFCGRLADQYQPGMYELKEFYDNYLGGMPAGSYQADTSSFNSSLFNLGANDSGFFSWGRYEVYFGQSYDWFVNPREYMPFDTLNPIGYFDQISANGLAAGWTCDQDAPAHSNRVDFYSNGTFTAFAYATLPSEPAVNNLCGGGTAHRFLAQLPASARGTTITAFGLDYTWYGLTQLPCSTAGSACSWPANPTPPLPPTPVYPYDGLQGVASDFPVRWNDGLDPSRRNGQYPTTYAIYYKYWPFGGFEPANYTLVVAAQPCNSVTFGTCETFVTGEPNGNFRWYVIANMDVSLITGVPNSILSTQSSVATFTVGQAAQTGISVVAGTYGGNCGASHGNVTGALRSACNTLGHCDYIVDYTILGDPAPGCGKDYVAEWTCNGQSLVQRATASPEAGFRKTVTLVCP